MEPILEQIDETTEDAFVAEEVSAVGVETDAIVEDPKANEDVAE